MKILIVDDHALFRAGLRLLLEVKRADADIQETANVDETIAWLACNPPPDLCLLDLDLKTRSGADLLCVLRKKSRAIKVVLVSATDDVDAVLACLQAGAVGYIPKSATPGILSLALDRVLAGERFLPESFPEWDPDHPVSRPVLTQRQQQILLCLQKGMANKVIARELGISLYTVKDHITEILRILGAENRVQAVLKSQHGMPYDAGVTLRSGP